MAPWTRPSDLHRALECPASTVLPRKFVPQEEKSQSAKWGNEVHAWKEGQPPTPRVLKWAKEGGINSSIFSKLYPGGHHEVAYVMPADDPPAFVYESTVYQRKLIKASLGPADIWGIMDWEADADAPYLHIDDFKTGRREAWDTGEKLSPTDPRETPQVLVAGLHKLKAVPRPGILLSITNLPRYPKGTQPERWAEWLTAATLKEWEHERLIPARRLALAPEAGSHVRPGDWCRFCQCTTCPEHPDNQDPGGPPEHDPG